MFCERFARAKTGRNFLAKTTDAEADLLTGRTKDRLRTQLQIILCFRVGVHIQTDEFCTCNVIY